MSDAYDVMAPVHDRAARDAALARLRREDPVHWDEQHGWWLVTRHADVREVSRAPETFSSEPRGPWHVTEYQFSMQAMDGDRHRRHRGVVGRAFTPRVVAQLEEAAERYADAAIERVAQQRHADFVEDLAVPVPLRIIADMIGVADTELDRFRAWSDALVLAGGGHGDEAALAETMRLMSDFLGYLGEAVERRRREPGSDILSLIVRAGEEGVLDGESRLHLDGDEIRDFALFLLVAGNETTRNAIAQGMLTLFEHPEERARLTDDESLWSTASDEILRWTSPVRAMRRVALHDTTLGGRPIAAGDSVVMIYASANSDEAVFDEPYRFRVDRDPNEHLAFGFGPHYCLGANLARMEVRAVLRKILRRLPGIRLASGGVAVPTPSALIDGLDALPVEW